MKDGRAGMKEAAAGGGTRRSGRVKIDTAAAASADDHTGRARGG